MTPGASRGTSTIDCCAWRGALVSVLPITMKIAQCGLPAPELNHLRPLITYSSPSRRIVHWMLVASDEATAGSVIRNAERISPASSGLSQRCFWASVA